MITPDLAREPDEDRDVIIVCNREVIYRESEPSEPTTRDVFTVWVGQDHAEFDSKAKAEEHGRQLAEQKARPLWLTESEYPPKLLWRPPT